MIICLSFHAFEHFDIFLKSVLQYFTFANLNIGIGTEIENILFPLP